MTVKILDNGRTIVHLSETFDFDSIATIRAEIEKVVSRKMKTVTFDLSKLDHIDSSGVGVLVAVFKRITGYGGEVKIVGAKGQPLSFLKLLGLSKIIEIRDDES